MKKQLSLILRPCLVLAGVLLGGTPAWAEGPASWSVGGYSNFGLGSQGITLVPGVTVGGSGWTASAHYGLSASGSEVAVSGDRLGEVGPGLPWLRVGPGVYFGVAEGETPTWGAGVRGVVRVDGAFGPVALFGAVIPALGAVWSDQVTLVWNADLELGLTYLLP